MCEPRQLNTVLLAQQALVMPSLLDIVNLDRLVALGSHEKLPRVVEIE